MRTPRPKHIHKVKRVTLGKGHKVFACVHPECYFNLPVKLLFGKEVLCWKCGEPIIVGPLQMRQARPSHIGDSCKRAVLVMDKEMAELSSLLKKVVQK